MRYYSTNLALQLIIISMFGDIVTIPTADSVHYLKLIRTLTKLIIKNNESLYELSILTALVFYYVKEDQYYHE